MFWHTQGGHMFVRKKHTMNLRKVHKTLCHMQKKIQIKSDKVSIFKVKYTTILPILLF